VGFYYDTVLVTAPAAANSTARIRVNLTVSRPQISVFGGVSSALLPPNDTATRKLPINNIGAGGPLNWSASHRASWLTISPASGTTPDTIRLSISSQGLPNGDYIDTVVVTAPGASNSPQTFNQFLGVRSQEISLPSAVTFDIIPGESSLLSTGVLANNSGYGAFAWTVMKTAPWLAITPTSGTATRTANSLLTATVDTTGLSGATTLQTFRDTIVFSAPAASNTPQKLPVTLTIQPPPTIAVLDTPVFLSAMSGSSTAATTTFRISNVGGGRLNWTVSDDASWLTLSPTSGSFRTSVSTVTATASPVGLAVGTYTATLTTAATGATNTPRTNLVTFRIAPVYDGTWSGRTGIDTTITFQISNNRITTITAGLGQIPSSCGGTISGTRTNSVSIDVNPGAFGATVRKATGFDAFGFPISYDILYYNLSGTFSSPTSVAGSITMIFSNGSCGGSYTTTWSATRQ
jgi:hypothetical protein